jgi:hypothetical protein
MDFGEARFLLFSTLEQMKLKEIALFCAIFLGIAFSQDSLFVPAMQDTSVAIPDTSAIAAQDSSVALPDTSVAALDSSVAAIDTSAAAADTAMKEIKSGLHFFIGAGAHFITFKDRSKFQASLEEQFAEYVKDYEEDTEGYYEPQKQDFQYVNLTFPISAGLMWHFNAMHSIGLGATFIYNKESVVLTDKNGQTRNLQYTLQAFPVFAEYRLQISSDILSLRNGDYFSVFLRYYWLVPQTEFRSSWGNAKAEFDPSGSGYGFFLGYRFLEWESFSFWGELGFLSLDAKSSTQNSVLDSWNLGGISVLIRIMI